MAVKYTDYNICTFNCHGMKGSLEYLLELASSHDVLFINEHWLQQKGIHTICSITETNNPKIMDIPKIQCGPKSSVEWKTILGPWLQVEDSSSLLNMNLMCFGSSKF